MTVKELIDKLQRERQDATIVVGHEMHDYCGRVMAVEPSVEHGRTHIEAGDDQGARVTSYDDYEKYEEDDDFVVERVVLIS